MRVRRSLMVAVLSPFDSALLYVPSLQSKIGRRATKSLNTHNKPTHAQTVWDCDSLQTLQGLGPVQVLFGRLWIDTNGVLTSLAGIGVRSGWPGCMRACARYCTLLVAWISLRSYLLHTCTPTDTCMDPQFTLKTHGHLNALAEPDER